MLLLFSCGLPHAIMMSCCLSSQEARKIAKGSKITALYVARQDGSFIDLADDRYLGNLKAQLLNMLMRFAGFGCELSIANVKGPLTESKRFYLLV